MMQLVSKISNLCDPDPPTSQTDRQIDGQTDGQHAISIPRYALVHRAVIILMKLPTVCMAVLCLYWWKALRAIVA